MKIAAAYIRVSDERQTEYSPDSQLKLIRSYAAQHDFFIPDEYIFQDDGISAKSAAKRVEFNRMISCAKDKSHPFETILVWKFSRFARNQEESIVFKSLLKRCGVSVISISEPIIEGAFGSLIERIIEWFDAYYLLNLSIEVKRGMTEKASRGEPLCRPAFGYDMRDGRYYPNADAPTVQRIFREYLEGVGMRSIALQLGREGVRTPRGNPPDNRFIDYILHNPLYVGKLRWSTNGRAASRREFDSDTFMIVPGKHEAIIDQQTFDRAQELIAEQKRHYRPYARVDHPAEWMLKGLVRCDTCGATLIRSNYKSEAAPGYLQCHNYARGSCTVSHALSVRRANAYVIEYLEHLVSWDDLAVAPRVSRPQAQPPADLQKLLEKERRKLEKVRDAYVNGADTLEEYAAAKVKLLQNIQQLEQAIAAAQESAETPAQPAPDLTELRATIRGVLDIIHNPAATEAAKNSALRSVISHIIFEKPAARLVIYLW